MKKIIVLICLAISVLAGCSSGENSQVIESDAVKPQDTAIQASDTDKDEIKESDNNSNKNKTEEADNDSNKNETEEADNDSNKNETEEADNDSNKNETEEMSDNSSAAEKTVDLNTVDWIDVDYSYVYSDEYKDSLLNGHYPMHTVSDDVVLTFVGELIQEGYLDDLGKWSTISEQDNELIYQFQSETGSKITYVCVNPHVFDLDGTDFKIWYVSKYSIID